MPPIGMHMFLARQLAKTLADPRIAAEEGAYYLGSTAPDIRVLTRWERERTHFFDLHRFDEQSGVENLFRAYPELARPEALNPPTVAFLAGYLTHLVLDEQWIRDVYRPCFGERSPLKGDVLANVKDRVLQFELDRREREDARAAEEIRLALERCTVDIAVEFLERETLLRWRDISLEILRQAPDWSRLRLIAGRHLREYGVETDQALDEFLTRIPELLEETVREVTTERVQAFFEAARERSIETVRSYLS